MDFLEHQHIEQLLREERAPYRVSHRRGEDLMHELTDETFKRHYRFTKDGVRDIVNALDDTLG